MRNGVRDHGKPRRGHPLGHGLRCRLGGLGEGNDIRVGVDGERRDRAGSRCAAEGVPGDDREVGRRSSGQRAAAEATAGEHGSVEKDEDQRERREAQAEAPEAPARRRQHQEHDEDHGGAKRRGPSE